MYLPQEKLRPLSELLGDETLGLTAANGTDIPFDGWVDVSFRLSTGQPTKRHDKKDPFD